MERRLYERISVPIKLKYEAKNRPRLVSESLSKNISGGGICISLKEKLIPKTELALRIEIGSKDDAVVLSGKVVWVRRVEIVEKNSPTVYYDTGIEFIDANPITINRVITHFYGKSFET
jgi:c-di-GMP-binding flagellar brake protein YcgR